MRKPKLHGAEAVEMALILPVLFLMLFLIVEVAVALYNKQVITYASREGARRGILLSSPRLPATGSPSITSVVTQITDQWIIRWGAETTTVNVECINTCGAATNQCPEYSDPSHPYSSCSNTPTTCPTLRVTVTHTNPFPRINAFLVPVGLEPWTMNSSTTMICE